MNRRIPPLPTPRLAHERAILDNWKEDDGVYVTLRLTLAPRREPANGPDAADAEAGSPEAPACLRLEELAALRLEELEARMAPTGVIVQWR